DWFHKYDGRFGVPIERWHEMASKVELGLPIDRKALDVICGIRDRRKLRDIGLRLHNGLRYVDNDERDLQKIRRRYGVGYGIVVRHYDWNLGSIHIEHPNEKRLIALPEADPG